MESRIFLYQIVLCLIIVGCSSEDSFLEPKVDVIVSNEDAQLANADHNRWTYEQMVSQYFWYKDIPDSTALDFDVEPSSFFKSLLSPEDRFSWCEVNTHYNGGKTRAGIYNLKDSVYVTSGKRIGYVVYDGFDDSPEVRSIFNKMKTQNIDELVLDLRNNHGGYVSTCNLLASYIAPKEALGKPFQIQRHNDKLCELKKTNNNPEGLDTVYLQCTQWYLERTLNLKRLFVLTTQNTASASEALINGLRPYMQVLTIGKTSRGKDVGSYTIADNNYKFQLQPITFRYYNAVMDSVPVTGIVPDIYIEPSSKYSLGDINEPLLNAAIKYIEKN